MILQNTKTESTIQFSNKQSLFLCFLKQILMSNSKKTAGSTDRYTITAALPYTNGPVHIGHLAGVYVPADIYARYLRNTGNDVLYICGIPAGTEVCGYTIPDIYSYIAEHDITRCIY